MLESHPNIATLSIQTGAIPNLQLEFEEAVFALAKALQVPAGRPLIRTCDQYKPHQAQTFKECDRLVTKIKGSYNTSMPATLVVTDPSFFDKGVACSQREITSGSKLFMIEPEPFETQHAVPDRCLRLDGRGKSSCSSWCVSQQTSCGQPTTSGRWPLEYCVVWCCLVPVRDV